MCRAVAWPAGRHGRRSRCRGSNISGNRRGTRDNYGWEWVAMNIRRNKIMTPIRCDDNDKIYLYTYRRTRRKYCVTYRCIIYVYIYRYIRIYIHITMKYTRKKGKIRRACVCMRVRTCRLRESVNVGEDADSCVWVQTLNKRIIVVLRLRTVYWARRKSRHD